jgi:hypothetical protein
MARRDDLKWRDNFRAVPTHYAPMLRILCQIEWTL